jgi:SAM-dependent methyltransferase
VSDSERVEWDRRYAGGEHHPRTTPAPILVRWLPRLKAGRALDIACGTGGNAVWLAEQGFRVDAIDISRVAIEEARESAESRGLAVGWQVADVDDVAFETDSYDVITVVRYVNRGLWPRLVEALAPDGCILMENHLNTRLDVAGPTSPAFRIDPQELLEAFSGLRILEYSETIETGDSGSRLAMVRMAACKGDLGW